jgi:ATP synthase protein I
MIENAPTGVDFQALGESGSGCGGAGPVGARPSQGGGLRSARVSQSIGSVEPEEPEVKVLTASEVRQIEAAQPSVTLWQLWRIQLLVSVGLLVLLALLPGWSWVVAAAAGSGVGLLPAALAALVWPRRPAQNPAQALLGLMVWELVKIVLSVALLVLIVLVVPGLNWLGLLLGMIVSMKAGWVYLLLKGRTLAYSKNQ